MQRGLIKFEWAFENVCTHAALWQKNMNLAKWAYDKYGDAEYLRNCNAGIFPKWICRNISEVMLHVGISPKYQCRNISEII